MIEIAHRPAERRYVVLDGGRVIGQTRYLPFEDRQRIFFHTEVDDAYAGQGLASRLVAHALDDTIAAGMRVVPVCRYVAGFVKKHPDYADHVDEATPEHLQALTRERR